MIRLNKLSICMTPTFRRCVFFLKFILAVSAIFVLGLVRHIHSNALEKSLRYIAQDIVRGNVEADPQGNLDYKTDWKKVGGGQLDLFIYSAYSDYRIEPPSVRIVALASRETEVFVECSMWTASNSSTTVRGRVRNLPEYPGSSYGAAYLECPLPTSSDATNLSEPSQYLKFSREKPLSETTRKYSIFSQKSQVNNSYVEDDLVSNKESDPVVRVALSTVPGMSKNYSSSIPVDNLANRRKKGELNVCVKQMHSNFNSASRLVEFIELQRLLGADHFTFYNLSIGPEVDRVLQHYVEEGLADVMPYSAPVMEDGLWYYDYGIVACLNDCILRSAGLYSLAAVIDTDEYIIPRKGGDLIQMVQELGHYTEYNARNLFYYLFYDDDEGEATKDGPDQPYLVTQKKTRRMELSFVHYRRSKYLCRPEEVYTAGNHYLLEFFGEHSVLHMSGDVALSHHYRNCDGDLDGCKRHPTMVDRTMHRYKKPLTSAVVTSCKIIFPERQGCPPHPELTSS